MNNRTLFGYHREIEKMKSSILYQFNRSKIQEFYKQNGIRIQTLMEKLEKLNREFFVIENERIKMIEKEGKPPRAVYQEGKTQQEFNKAYNELMDQKNSITLV